MANTHDTIDGLLAEFRGYAAGMPASYHVTMSWADFRKMLDRFEAANKREVATTKESLAVGNSGDCAKLREALKLYDRILQDRTLICDCDIVYGARTLARAALAAPPRNCDMFATVDEARKAHEAICEKYGKCHHGCPLNNEEHYSAFDCFEAWLFAPATEKEGGNNADK